jgi:hypothetical protein
MPHLRSCLWIYWWKPDRFVACTSCRFYQVYLETLGDKTSTCIESAAKSVSRVQLCLHSGEPGCNSHAESLLTTAAEAGKQEKLIWGEDSGYEPDTILNTDVIIAQTALNGHSR